MSLTSQDIVAAFKKHPISFGAGLLAVLIGAGWYIRGTGVAELEMTLEDRTGLGQKQQNNVRFSALLDDQLAAVDAAVAEINTRAISPAALAINLQYIYQLEAEHGIKLLDLQQVNLPPPRTKPNYLGVPFTVSAQGTYRSLIEFVRALENGRRFARIDTFRLSPSGGIAGATVNRSDPVLTLTLDFNLLAKP